MQDPEIALKHANVISHACKLSGLLLASMLIREILCGCVWLFSQFMDDEFETFVFAANRGVENSLCCLNFTNDHQICDGINVFKGL